MLFFRFCYAVRKYKIIGQQIHFVCVYFFFFLPAKFRLPCWKLLLSSPIVQTPSPSMQMPSSSVRTPLLAEEVARVAGSFYWGKRDFFPAWAEVLSLNVLAGFPYGQVLYVAGVGRLSCWLFILWRRNGCLNRIKSYLCARKWGSRAACACLQAKG